MQIPRVVPLDPRGQGPLQFYRARPLPESEQFFFERPHEPCYVGVPFRVVVARERLRDLERAHVFMKATEGG